MPLGGGISIVRDTQPTPPFSATMRTRQHVQPDGRRPLARVHRELQLPGLGARPESRTRASASASTRSTPAKATASPTCRSSAGYPRTPGQQDYVVAFRSLASDLVSGVTKTNGRGPDDLRADARRRRPSSSAASRTARATGNGDDFIRDISPDGRYIIFTSTSSNIVPGLTDTSAADLFRRDLVTNTTIVLTAAQPSGVDRRRLPLQRTRRPERRRRCSTPPPACCPPTTNNDIDIYFSGAIPAPSISGTVTASGGAALAGVTLTLTGTSGGTATTGAPGTYAFTSLTANGHLHGHAERGRVHVRAGVADASPTSPAARRRTSSASGAAPVDVLDQRPGARPERHRRRRTWR